MMNADVHLKGPYAISEGPSCISLGELLQTLRDLKKYGRTAVMNGNGEPFHVILYDDDSWRISTTQLELFPTEKTHTLT